MSITCRVLHFLLERVLLGYGLILPPLEIAEKWPLGFAADWNYVLRCKRCGLTWGVDA